MNTFKMLDSFPINIDNIFMTKTNKHHFSKNVSKNVTIKLCHVLS